MVVVNRNVPPAWIPSLGQAAGETPAAQAQNDALGAPPALENAIDRPALVLNPVASAPVAGAFDSTQTPRTRAASPRPAWDGPIATSETLGEMAEQRFLSRAGDCAVVLPYRTFDARRPPVILFHGLMNPSANLMAEMADRLTDEGKQVYIVYYRDIGETAAQSGKQVAQRLAEIREKYYPEGTRVDVVGLCIGGVVARSALNYLQNPNWLGDGGELISKPRAGFGPIRFRSVDTLWDGFFHEPPEDREGLVVRVIKRILSWLGLGGAMELRATSRMFEHLHDVPLEGVDFQNIGVAKPVDSWFFRSVPQYDEKEAQVLAQFVLQGDPPQDVRLRNFTSALEQETRYPSFKQALARRLLAERVATDRPSAALRRAVVEEFEAAMPSFAVLGEPDNDGKREMKAGWLSHIMGLKNDLTRDDDLFDGLVRELTSSPR